MPIVDLETALFRWGRFGPLTLWPFFGPILYANLANQKRCFDPLKVKLWLALFHMAPLHIRCIGPHT